MTKDVLVIIDVQNDFVTGSLGTQDAQEILPKITELVEGWNKGDIYYTYDTHDSSYLGTHEGKLLPVEHCIKGQDGWEYPEQLMQALVKFSSQTEHKLFPIEKRVFGSLSLPYTISKNSKPTSITICGLVTDICVISNALLLRAAFPEIEITVLSECCAGVTPEMHLKALDVMRSCQINVI